MTTPRAEVLAAAAADWLDRDDVAENRAADELRARADEFATALDAALAAQEGDQGEAVEVTPLGDHPYVDPRDGRIECYLCGKFVHDVTHSCKGVPVTRAAEHRVRALIDAVRADAASPDAGAAVRAVAAVETVHYRVPDPEDRPGVFWCSCAGGSEEHPYYEYDDCPTRAALADTTGALAIHDAKVKAAALREAADLADKAVITGLETTRPDRVAIWLRKQADRIEAEAADQ